MLTHGLEHTPVMEAEVVEFFSKIPPGLVVDATVGGGGHAAALLQALPTIRLLGLDRDPEAARVARERLASFGDRVVVRHACFDQLTELVVEELRRETADVLARQSAPGRTSNQSGGVDRDPECESDLRVSGVLFDLGVSSMQLDQPLRGFSYRSDGPLDMRMNPEDARTAADIVNAIDEGSLATLFAAHGEARYARRLAHAIVVNRPLITTAELAEVVCDAIPAVGRRRGHPAKRVFQALRVEVNRELSLLGPTLDQAIALLRSRGRCVVLSYHSGEDRIVKRHFATAASGGCQCPAWLPCDCDAVSPLRVLTRGAKLPSAVEVNDNSRAAGARLRAVERLEVPGSRPYDEHLANSVHR